MTGYLVLNPLEVEDSEVRKFVDDEQSVVGLGHDGIVKQR